MPLPSKEWDAVSRLPKFDLRNADCPSAEDFVSSVKKFCASRQRCGWVGSGGNAGCDIIMPDYLEACLAHSALQWVQSLPRTVRASFSATTTLFCLKYQHSVYLDAQALEQCCNFVHHIDHATAWQKIAKRQHWDQWLQDSVTLADKCVAQCSDPAFIRALPRLMHKLLPEDVKEHLNVSARYVLTPDLSSLRLDTVSDLVSLCQNMSEEDRTSSLRSAKGLRLAEPSVFH